MAPSRNANSSVNTPAPVTPRLSFAKISESLPVPDLLDLQVPAFGADAAPSRPVLYPLLAIPGVET